MGLHTLHTKHVVTYDIDGQHVEIDLCWKGEVPEQDADRFYDLFDENGVCLNQGDPWHDDDEGIPSIEDVTEFINCIH